MREIKFRAWDRSIHEMWSPLPVETKFCIFKDTDNWAVMQYVGLKDKNDVEIYEGDILRQDDGRITQIVWHDHCAMFDLLGITSDGVPHPLSDRPSLLQEVIGNIYENPELLKEEA